LPGPPHQRAGGPDEPFLTKPLRPSFCLDLLSDLSGSLYIWSCAIVNVLRYYSEQANVISDLIQEKGGF